MKKLVCTLFALVAFTVTKAQFISIATIQTPTASTGASTYSGSVVSTGGIVTAVVTGTAGTGLAFYMESSGGGQYSGVYVYSPTYAPQVTPGDSVNFSGTVTEFYGMTEIQTLNNFNKVSSANAIPAPMVISPISNVKAEQYEGVLVRITNVQCSTTPNTYQEWNVTNGGNTVTVGSKTFTYSPTVGTSYDITGNMLDDLSGTTHYWTIQPRKMTDIVAAGTAGIEEHANAENLVVYPNPASATLSFNMKNNEVISSIVITDVLGRTVYSSKENLATVDVSKLEKGVYNIYVTTAHQNYTSKFVVGK